ncbi:transketolase [Candidatus Collierbacteria bacterium RIFOXYB2_FULL_46_14]|uniref:Transketolase domain protein n=1 Tax=Candidatus Collierbacteria bacterium GW2011_GWA2_46_26 TaxID=1618381 RepID=A0A0G1PJE1_9BACT|nr:MAG: Transketolase domain protein [Candidatus Collierbacteria bacterium GW2011_GWC2_44_13]KKU32934.1 MAG: Transketolase domain protein [Candidatus Collierbacteria bacterium GW2011_GWA2_46_26]OGD72911.1 MAG: transketolase [Candidatus Collierbacteria bacterium RIFOXYB2_FULL_46_14]OGD75953.1 MAG: transketolase [Candidatus Collierbacteria bacterium RIFOXYA2_FULL_46_20]OGD77289.1 MAG: transketolase [Candidatus Collierbacteria bacterium RIFOXYC2_FULL_43_15]OGD80578.1 MAG: transketolase [Pseudomon
MIVDNLDVDLTQEKLLDLQEKAVKARELVIETLLEAKSGHSAGPLGMADIFVALYFHILNHDPKDPHKPDRDRLILSNGHICPIRYVVMAMAGYFPIEELKTLRKLNSRLQGHPHRTALDGVETTSGPLGEGISQAIGYALAAKLDNKDHYIYCITSDGEHQEGNTWEAIMFAGKNKINNMTVIIDRNNIQIDGFTEDIMPLEPLREKYEAFGWHVLEVDGNNIRTFVDAVREAKAIFNKPTVIIAHTIPGKGVSFMENNYLWHGAPPDVGEVAGSPAKGDQAKTALADLRTLQGKIESEHQ